MTPETVWYCPWCEGVLAHDGELVTEEADAYWHTYEHRDKAMYAMEVLEEFEEIEVVPRGGGEAEPEVADGDD